MDATRAAEAAEHLADLGPHAGAALAAMRLAADRTQTTPQLVIAIDAILAGHASSPLPPAVFAALVEATTRARDVAQHVVDRTIERPKLCSAIDAVVGLVCFWAMSEPERRRVDPELVASSVALARILRNALESLCLVEMLHDQERRRLQSTVDRIKADALAAVAGGSAYAP